MHALSLRCLFVAAFSVLAFNLWAADDDEDHIAHQSGTTGEAVARMSEGKAHARLRAIEDLMSRILASNDGSTRRELLSEHLAAMRDHMRAIRSDPGHPQAKQHHERADAAGAGDDDGHAARHARDDDGGKGRMMCKKKGMMDSMMGMHRKVEHRLHTLERMLRQLIEHEAVERELEEN